MRTFTETLFLTASLTLASLTLAAGSLTSQEFVTQATEAGMAEVELSKLALQKSNDVNIKSFAERMVTDHGKAGAELMAIAEKKRLMPSRSLNAAHQKALTSLREKSGADFDDAYSDQMEADHEKAIDLFTDAAMSDDPELAAFAAKTLPTLRVHEELAKHLEDTH